MAKLIKKISGTFIVATGGHENRRKIPGSEVEVVPPVEEIDHFEWSEEADTGTGFHSVTIFRDSTGKKIALEEYWWNPAPGYCWDEAWERVTDDESEIERLYEHKTIEERDLV